MALEWVHKNTIVAESLKNSSQMLLVLLSTRAGNKQVINMHSKNRTWLMNIWNVCAAFRRPKGIRINSKRLNGVVMAVFGISVGSTGI